MKQGSTFILLVSLDVDIRYMDSIIFTIKNGNKVLTKTDYLYDAEKKQFQLFLTQEDTIEMQGRCLIEAQINFTDLHVAKSEIGTFIMNPTLATKIMTGNQATTDGEEVALEVDGEIVYIGGSGGTSDYMHLENKPQINGVELIGNKSAKELGIEVPKKTSDLDNDSGFIKSPTTAEVGQMLVVKAVDENGVPTEWECVTASSGGSSSGGSGGDNTGGDNGDDNNDTPTDPTDTSAKIAEYGKGLTGIGTTKDQKPTCITEFYDIPDDYTGNITFLVPYDEESSNWSVAYLEVFEGETLKTQWNMGNNFVLNGVGGTPRTVGLYYANSWPADKFRMTLITKYLDDSFAYFTKTGDIIFAGANTHYYGMANIDGTMVSNGDVSEAQLIDNDYAQDYGVSTLSLVTDIAETNVGLIDTEFAIVVEEAKNAWMTEANGNINKIPLIIHTDQHGSYNKPLFDFISKIVDWYDVGKVINLGDTVNDWGDTSNLLTCDGLESYVKSMANIPYSKRIEVFGNHDCGTTPQNHLHKYFRNIYARRIDNHGNFVVVDDNYNVKYVVVSGFAFDDELGGHSHYIIPPTSIDWIIKELEKQDRYDVIILSHVPLGANVTPTDPTTGENAQYTPTHACAVTFKLLTELWEGRKAKTSGSVTDEYNIVHEFDFTSCDGELLCGLHGHMHEDSYYYIGELLDVCFDAYCISPNAIHFVLVDRENRQLNVWKVDNTPQYQNYQIPFDKPTDTE